MGKKVKKIPPYLYNDDAFCNFAMVTADLFRSWQFQELTHASKIFYMICATHKETPEQTQCLFNSLKEYFTLKGEVISDFDLQLLSGQNKRAKLKSMLFVIPESHLKQYGISSQYASKLKKELIEKGFIKIYANEKKHAGGNLQGANRDFSKRVTIYEFINDWKRRTE